MLDIDLFREDKDHNPEIIRESQRRRFANVKLVDDIIRLDIERQARLSEVKLLRKDYINFKKEVTKFRKAGEDATMTVKVAEDIKQLISKKFAEYHEAQAALFSRWKLIGNLVHDSVPISNDEANNVVIRTWGEKRLEPNLKNHVDLVELLGIADTRKGSVVAGGEGFYLKGDGVLLNQALMNFGLSFLNGRGYSLLQTPSCTRKDKMAQCVQLAQFKELEVTGNGDDEYLTAVAELPLCAHYIGKWIKHTLLPLRYSGCSSCFFKETDAHGIPRHNQFDKVEQFCITGPNGNDSWDMLEEMLKTSEEFYQMLKLPYQVVAVVSGVLNAADAKKYDLEAWFPASKGYMELMSCSNRTDYQSRHLEIQYGQNKSAEQAEKYVHLLNATLTANERTICCILENYQKEDGVEVPEALRPFMGGRDFLPFQNLRTRAVNGADHAQIRSAPLH